ncbi:calmodulin-binding family protein [Tripterygium wilfordii]|uniref:Calmodulin-binding family protein n=1 Tax=Tripterygium wilfordii TaxID=458696 RepID=A0A7J7BWM3_TRIWF|nr:ataxin-2 homolog [Tripterygium wilfordii]XP_038696291.1 ataxin-2 homolog [Tripterygium wilfordii]KAF5726299.1 calmodulin-binding family protein [Tripterygium wilfordii]
MATTARENNKDKKAISSHNSSHGHSSSSSSSSSSTRTSSTRPNSSMADQKSPTNGNNNGKSVPNYLKPTMSSRHESFKYVIKKNNNNEETTKPSILRRRSFDRPQSASSPSSRVQKALISPGPRQRSSRTLTVRSASFSSSKINASPKPIVDRISKTPKATKSTTMPTTFSKNNVKNTSVNIPFKKEPLRKSASASSSKASTPPPPETPNNNDQENQGEHEEVALVHVDDHNEEMANSVEEVLKILPSELPNSVVNAEQVPFNGDHEDEKKLDVIALSEEQQDISKINQLPTQTHEEDGDGQCDQEETSNNSNQYQESTNLTLTSGETTNQLESSQEEYDDKSKETDNPTDDHEIPTKEETVDVENKLAEEGKEEVDDDGNKELGQNDTGVVVVEEEVKLPNIVAPTKPQGGSNHGRKESSPAYNDVIEETASKLLEKRKNKVKALVGAFETVIDYESSSK